MLLLSGTRTIREPGAEYAPHAGVPRSRFHVFKNQNLWGERLKAQFWVEMFNILNNAHLTAQTPTIFDRTGKLVTAVGTPVAPTANASHQIQLGLRLLF